MYDKKTQALLLEKGVKCVCQLCDCGRPHKHQGCTKYWSGLPIGRQKGSLQQLESDYMNSYSRHMSAHPAATYRPLCRPRNPNPPPMDFRTVNKTEFKSHGKVTRPQPFKLKGEIESVEGSFEGKSVYRTEYPSHEVKQPTLIKEKRATTGSGGVFRASTTYSDVFKSKALNPNPGFSELPSFTYSVLYPGDSADMTSHSHEIHKGLNGQKSLKVDPPSSTLKLGDSEVHYLSTTHRTEFQRLDPSARSRIAKPKEILQQRPKFTAVTQSRDDFKGFKGEILRPPKPITPPPETISIGQNFSQSFETTNRAVHKVTWDPKLMTERKGRPQEHYQAPDAKFDAVSLTHSDFTKHKLSPVAVKRDDPKPVTKCIKFDDETSYKKHFPSHGNIHVRRYGDFHESKSYLPPSEKFHTDGSVMKQDFKLLYGKPSTPCKPEYALHSTGGAFDDSTSYGTSFKPVKLKECIFQSTMNKLLGHVHAV